MKADWVKLHPFVQKSSKSIHHSLAEIRCKESVSVLSDA